METVHGTCVAVDGKGVLLVGPPGSGKSDLALRLIDEGGFLIADDLVALEAAAGQLHGNYPNAATHLKGVIEVRNVGLVKVPKRDWVWITLLVELGGTTERLPSPRTQTIAGIEIEALTLNAFETSTTAKIRAALIRERVSA